MYKDFRFINAGENEFYRWGRKAQELVKSFLVEKNGYLSMPADGGRYYTIGTSKGKFGEFAKIGDEYLSVNSAGYVWAKVGTPKEETFKKLVNTLLKNMTERYYGTDEEDEDFDE